MTSLDVLHYVLSISIIIIASTIVGIGVFFMILLYELRKTILAIKQTTKDIRELKASLQSGMIEGIVGFGRKIFQSQPPHE